MKFDLQKAFPYPVLRPYTDDYLESEFQVTADFEFVANTNEIKLSLTFITSCEEIQSLVESGDAAYVAVVACRETYYRDIITTSEHVVSASYLTSSFRGEVEVMPFIVAKNKIKGYVSEDINPEFGSGPFDFSKGEVLALDEPQAIFVDLELFKPISSVFDLVKDDNLSEAEWVVHFDDDHVKIALGQKTKEELDNARNGSRGKAILINSLYFSAVTEAIQILKESSEFDSRRWAKVFRQQCHNENIDIAAKPAYEIATRLMRYPMRLLSAYVFEGDEL